MRRAERLVFPGDRLGELKGVSGVMRLYAAGPAGLSGHGRAPPRAPRTRAGDVDASYPDRRDGRRHARGRPDAVTPGSIE